MRFLRAVAGYKRKKYMRHKIIRQETNVSKTLYKTAENWLHYLEIMNERRFGKMFY
jgi:hypothetical protein